MPRLLLTLLILLLAGCTLPRLPPMPEDAVAKRFKPMPDKSVIYLVRHRLDPSYIVPVVFDDQMIGSTYGGTYMRIETSAGKHRLSGFAADSGSITLTTEPGKLYFVQHSAYGFLYSFHNSNFQLVDGAYGRTLVMGGEISALISQ